jgi:hypothetical protein
MEIDMTFKYLESRLNKLPKTEYDWDADYDQAERKAPVVKVWTNDEGEQVVCLSSEQGNMACFEYLGDSDYMVDLVPEVHDWAKQYGWEWQCHYQGTYFLYKV